MSSSVLMKCASAPCLRMASRTCASLSARLTGLRRDVFVDACVRQAGAAFPDVVQQVGADLQRGARRGGGGRQGAEGRQAQHLSVHADALTRPRVGGQPIHMAGRGGQRDLHQLHAGAGQLRLGLHPVAAVDPQAGEIGRDHQRAHRAREARQPAPPCQRAGRYSERCGSEDGTMGRQAAAAHGLPQQGDTGIGTGHGKGILNAT